MLADSDNTVLTPNEIEELIKSTQAKFNYRVYFDNVSGDIYAISNEAHPAYKNFIEVQELEIVDFLIGKKDYSSYRVLYTSPTESKIVLKSQDPEVGFKTLIEVKEVVDTSNVVIAIENNTKKKQWIISINEKDRKLIKRHGVNSKFEFYVTLASNPNFLIRTIKIEAYELANNYKLYVDHITTVEHKVEKIKIFTQPFFENYGLIIS